MAWAVGFLVHFRSRRRAGDVLSQEHRLLFLIESAGVAAGHVTDTDVLFGGKSIVGGLVGGVAAVEATKKWQRVKVATGDLLVMPLVIGMPSAASAAS